MAKGLFHIAVRSNLTTWITIHARADGIRLVARLLIVECQ
jgi:hypothetical protein